MKKFSLTVVMSVLVVICSSFYNHTNIKNINATDVKFHKRVYTDSWVVTSFSANFSNKLEKVAATTVTSTNLRVMFASGSTMPSLTVTTYNWKRLHVYHDVTAFISVMPSRSKRLVVETAKLTSDSKNNSLTIEIHATMSDILDDSLKGTPADIKFTIKQL